MSSLGVRNRCHAVSNPCDMFGKGLYCVGLNGTYIGPEGFYLLKSHNAGKEETKRKTMPSKGC